MNETTPILPRRNCPHCFGTGHEGRYADTNDFIICRCIINRRIKASERALFTANNRAARRSMKAKKENDPCQKSATSTASSQ